MVVIVNWPRRGDIAVLQDADVGADFENFVQAVRDVDEAHPLIPQIAQNHEQMVDLPVGEHRRRLIQNEYAGPGSKRLGDFHHLRLGNAKPVERRVGVQIDAELLEQVDTVAAKRAPVD